MIEFRAVTYRSGDRLVLDRESRCVGAGEATGWCDCDPLSADAIVRLVLGLDRPLAGRVLVDGVNSGRDPVKARRRLTYIPRDVKLYPRLTGVENLAYLVALAGQTPDLGALRFQMDACGLGRESHDRLAIGYSREMRQRVLMALARVKGVSSVLWEVADSECEEGPFEWRWEALNRLMSERVAVLLLLGRPVKLNSEESSLRSVQGGGISESGMEEPGWDERNKGRQMAEVLP